MKLKFKPLHLESGRPIAFINCNFAKKLNISEGDRIEIIYNEKKLILLVNLLKKFIEEDEISFSREAISFLKIRKGESVRISLALQPRSIRSIFRKLNNKELTEKEIYTIIKDIVSNALNEAEIAFFVSAVYHNGMSFRETIYLADAMAKTGKILKWVGKIADKHSIGGVPGNRTTPIVVSICAAAGIKMPKTSSRAITSAAGTADVVEILANVNLSPTELKSVVKKTNACLAWGGSLGLAPADDKLIKVERFLNIDPESQLIASIIAKKLSVGSKYILIDIPYGRGAKVSVYEARRLRKKFLKIGKHFKLKIEVVLTEGEQPIGNGIGPILEVKDVLRVLERNNPPLDLERKSVFLAGKILEFMGKARKGNGKIMAQKILDSGEALKKFEEIITAQGKKKKNPKIANFEHHVKVRRDGKIKNIDNKEINMTTRILGCPTSTASGIYLYKHKNELVKKGETLLILYSESKKKLNEAIRFYNEKKPIHL